MAEEEIPPAPPMTEEQTKKYREELEAELKKLEFDQTIFFSEYKTDRINRIKDRLGIPVN
jgi:ribosomal protein L29